MTELNARAPFLRHLSGRLTGRVIPMPVVSQRDQRSHDQEGIGGAMSKTGRNSPLTWWALAGGAMAMAALSAAVHAVPGVLAAVAAAVAGTAAALLSDHSESAAAPAGSDRALDDGLFRDARGRLPAVRDLDDPVAVGVHPAARASDGDQVPAFITRDVSELIEQALDEGGFVLIVGDSTAGKSRAAFEAVRARLPGHTFVCPLTPADLATAVTAALKTPRAVLWLDDLERYVGSEAFTAQTVRRLLGPRRHATQIVATLRARERAAFSPRYESTAAPPAFHRAAREILALAREIRLDRRWSPQEIQRAANSADKRLNAAAARAGKFGVAEYLASGPQLYQDWRDACSSTGVAAHDRMGGPRAGALVTAAVDARRAGCHTPLPVGLLRRLHEQYLAELGGAAVRPESWEEALRWAAHPPYGTSSLLMPGDAEDTFLAFDYLADALEATPQAPAVPQFTWNALITYSSPADCVAIGRAAGTRGKLDAAEAAFRKGAAARDLIAMDGLANCLGWTGRLTEALGILDEMVETLESHRDGAPDQLFDLKLSRVFWTLQTGQVRAALLRARDLVDESTMLRGDHTEKTLHARVWLSRCLGEAGEEEQALCLARTAAVTAEREFGRRHDVTMSARFEVAVATFQLGDFAAAAELFQSVLDDGIELNGPDSLYLLDLHNNIAHALGECGDYRAAVASADHAVSLSARLSPAGTMRAWISRCHWALCTAKAGDPQRALSQADGAVSECSRLHGPDHDFTLLCRHTRATVLYVWGRYDEARAAWEELLQAARNRPFPDARLLLDCRAGLATCMVHLGHESAGLARLNAVIIDFALVFGPHDRGVVTWRRELAALVRSAGRALDQHRSAGSLP